VPAIFEMLDELKEIVLGIGSRIGVMKKTMAHEILQRVLYRVSYIVGRKDKYTA
jgi:hypothetical protein